MEIEDLGQSVNRQSPYGKLDWEMRVGEEPGLESTVSPPSRLLPLESRLFEAYAPRAKTYFPINAA